MPESKPQHLCRAPFVLLLFHPHQNLTLQEYFPAANGYGDGEFVVGHKAADRCLTESCQLRNIEISQPFVAFCSRCHVVLHVSITKKSAASTIAIELPHLGGENTYSIIATHKHPCCKKSEPELPEEEPRLKTMLKSFVGLCWYSSCCVC